MLHWVVLLPFLFSVLMLFIRQTTRFHLGWIVLPLPAALFLLFLTKVPAIEAGEPIIHTIAWMPSFGVNLTFVLDGLSLLFVFLITGMGALVVLYSIFYLERTEGIGRFYVYLLLFMGAMLGVVLSDNLIVLYGFWELTSISSFLLIAFWFGRERSGYGAVKSMLITVFGGLAMFAGFNLLYVMTGTYSIREIIAQAGTLADSSLLIPAMLLILLGAFTKSAQFPFHIWLPDAMEAPTPVSAYLHSATMVKAGIYLVARLTPLFAGQLEWFWLVSVTGLITLIYGSFKAVRQTDLKALLAYSTISQLGLIMCLLGLGSAAFFTEGQDAMFYTMATTAALFHLINHAVFKGSLFMVVGIIDHETGTRDLRKLGGLMSLMPITFSVALMGASSMAGLPPFGGFLSKEMFFTSVLNIREFDLLDAGYWLHLFPVIAWVASVFTFLYSTILLFRTFGGKLQQEKLDKIPHEARLGLLVSPVILVSLTLVFAFFPDLVSVPLIAPAMASIHSGMFTAGESFEVSIHFWHGWTPEIFMTLGVVAAGLLLYSGLTRIRLNERESSGLNILNRLYDASLQQLERGSRRLTDAYMTGSSRRYLIYIFSFLVVTLLAVLLRQPGIRFGMEQYAPLSFYELSVVAVMLLASFAVPFAKSRVNAILFTGGAGYMVALLFVLFRAPDLALTQMIVETVSVILFLLCFRYLPKLSKEKERPRFKLPNLIIALGVGLTMTLIALAAMGSSPFESISDYFLKESYRLAGGKNVVNVILVDFRGFDTLFEIMVLGVASLSIYSLIHLRLEEDIRQERKGKVPLRAPMRSNDVILQTMSIGIILIILIFSLYLFLAGHNHPGGGFIGALMTSAALVLIAVAFGMDQIRKMLPVNYHFLTASGLLLAILTASGSFLFGAPFLSHTFGHFHIPILGDIELATAVLFDLGVYLAVVGVVMNIILTIGGGKRWNS